MYADQFATTGSSHRIGALFLQEMTHRVDACALARVYNAPRFTCDLPRISRFPVALVFMPPGPGLGQSAGSGTQGASPCPFRHALRAVGPISSQLATGR